MSTAEAVLFFMGGFIMLLNKEIIHFRKNYLRTKLNRLPSGVIRDIQCADKTYKALYISDYPGHPEYKRHRYSINSAKGRELLDLVLLRERLNVRLKELERMTDDSMECRVMLDESKLKQADEYWESIKKVADTNYRWDKPKNAPVYNGILFRSKSEMTIAMVLDEMELEYVYEPTVNIGGRTFNPDFAVYFRETGKVFFIEHFGKMGKESYREDNYDKFSFYINSGLKAGKDILMFFETDDAGIEPEVFRQQISALILVSISEVPYRSKTK